MTTLEKSLAVINTAPAAILTTFNAEGYPETRAMLNLRNGALFPALAPVIGGLDDGSTLIFTTNTASSKMKQLAADKKVSLYYCLAEQFKGVWVSGDMEILADAGEKARFWQPGWEMYYPGGKYDPDYTILKLCPRRVRMYENLSVAGWRRGEGA